LFFNNHKQSPEQTINQLKPQSIVGCKDGGSMDAVNDICSFLLTANSHHNKQSTSWRSHDQLEVIEVKAVLFKFINKENLVIILLLQYSHTAGAEISSS
jgi:hypothetical protein